MLIVSFQSQSIAHHDAGPSASVTWRPSPDPWLDADTDMSQMTSQRRQVDMGTLEPPVPTAEAAPLRPYCAAAKADSPAESLPGHAPAARPPSGSTAPSTGRSFATTRRMTTHSRECVLYVDPSCPHAWTTFRWLMKIEQHGLATVNLGIVSLSVVNEGRELEAWYREFNDAAWGPARVAVAAHDRHGQDGLRRFYTAYGQRRHVHKRRDSALLADALVAAGLEPLIDTAFDNSLDTSLRDWTNKALQPVAADVGTPVVHLNGSGFYGPVLTSVPQDVEAVALFNALSALSAIPAFVEYKRGRTPTQ